MAKKPIRPRPSVVPVRLVSVDEKKIDVLTTVCPGVVQYRPPGMPRSQVTRYFNFSNALDEEAEREAGAVRSQRENGRDADGVKHW